MSIPLECPAGRARIFKAATSSGPVIKLPPDTWTTLMIRYRDLNPECTQASPGHVTCTPDPDAFPKDGPLFPDTAAGRQAAVSYTKRILRDVRTSKIEGRKQVEALGIVIRFKLHLKNSGDRPMTIGWALWTKDNRLPANWAYTRAAAVVRTDVDDDRLLGHLWVPLPKKHGSYFVHVGIFDRDGNERDGADSGPFT